MYIYMPYVISYKYYIYYLDSRRLIAKRQIQKLLLQLMFKQAPKTWKHIAASDSDLWTTKIQGSWISSLRKTENWWGRNFQSPCLQRPLGSSWPSVIACAATKASHTAVAPPLVCLSRYGGPGRKQPRFQGLHGGRLRAPHVIMWWIHGVLQLIIFQLRKLKQQRDINFLRS